MKTCLGCKWCDFYGGSQGYSELTPGSEMRFSCDKSHWDAFEGSKDELLSCLLIAETCDDYERDPKLPPPQTSVESWL